MVEVLVIIIGIPNKTATPIFFFVAVIKEVMRRTF